MSDFGKLNIEPLIAALPADRREMSRLMVVHSATGEIEHRQFKDIAEYFNKGDCLVLNNSKVFPARVVGKKKTGGACEFLLCHPSDNGNAWSVLCPDGKPGLEVFFEEGLSAVIEGRTQNDCWLAKFNRADIIAYAGKYGHTPLPRYIIKSRKNKSMPAEIEGDRERYQTIYAKTDGSVAAPTAGLHFTNEVIGQIKQKSVEVCEVTLHVGWGTFKPLKTAPGEHKMPSELAEISEAAAQKINNCKANGGKIFAVGTTTTRTLESFAQNGKLTSGKKWTNIFIYPPYKFQIIDNLITNFHTPNSTPLCMAQTKAGADLLFKAYGEAVKLKYRFYSYGDSMLIL